MIRLEKLNGNLRGGIIDMKGKTEKLCALLLAVVIVVFSGWLFYQDFVAPRPVIYPAASDGMPTKARISFAQGHAVLEFYDTPMTWEFTERQPIVLQLERQGDHIVLPGIPPINTAAPDQQGMAPEMGDIALNKQSLEVVIFCKKEAWSNDWIPLGRVIGGMKYLLQTKGTFQVYATR